MTTASPTGATALNTTGSGNPFFSQLSDILGSVSGTVGAGGELISQIQPLWARNPDPSNVVSNGTFAGANAGTIPTNSSANVQAGSPNYKPYMIAGGIAVVLLVIAMFAFKGK